MNYRIKSESRFSRFSGLMVLMRLAVIALLVVFGNSAFAENSVDAPISERAPIESTAPDSEAESVHNDKSISLDNKRLSITANDSKIAPAPGVNATDWLKAILGLLAVVALIFAIAWFVKRFTGLAVSNQQQMRIVSAIPMGTKERIALIEVADKQLLVGITQHNINLLHSFEEPVVNKNDKTAVDFSSRLQAILSKGTSD